MSNKISILILDFLKPIESRACLESVHKFCNFDKKVIFLSNGGGVENQEYVLDYYSAGLIDQLILNKQNTGLGVGTEELFRICDTKYALYLQNDQFVSKNIPQYLIDEIVTHLESDVSLGAVGLAGYPCGANKYSERAHIINVNFYNTIPKTHGGCGPGNHLKYNEQCVQEYFEENNLGFYSLLFAPIQDNGVWTIREVAGGIVKMRTDTKETFWLNPPKEKYMFPEMTDEEWEISIAGNWIGGTIPEPMKKLSFNCWGENV